MIINIYRILGLLALGESKRRIIIRDRSDVTYVLTVSMHILVIWSSVTLPCSRFICSYLTLESKRKRKEKKKSF